MQSLKMKAKVVACVAVAAGCESKQGDESESASASAPTEARVQHAGPGAKEGEHHDEDHHDHEEAAESGDTAAFESAYRGTMSACNSCHAQIDHGFIEVGVPQYNPYPNLELE